MAEPEIGMPAWIKALIGLACLVFAANGAMVWMSLSGRRDLVRQDYYEAGLEQDARLARRSLAAAFDIEFNESDGAWKVTVAERTGGMPSGIPPAVGDGTRPRAASPLPSLEGSRCRIRFQRPEDGRLDWTTELAWAGGSPGIAAWRGPATTLRKGHWDVLIEWERNGEVFMETAFPSVLGK